MNLLLGGMQLLIFTTAASPHVASHRTIGPAAAFPANLEGWQDCLDNHFPQHYHGSSDVLPACQPMWHQFVTHARNFIGQDWQKHTFWTPRSRQTYEGACDLAPEAYHFDTLPHLVGVSPTLQLFTLYSCMSFLLLGAGCLSSMPG